MKKVSSSSCRTCFVAHVVTTMTSRAALEPAAVETTFYVLELEVASGDPRARRTVMVAARIGRDSDWFLGRISRYSFVSLDSKTGKKALSTGLR